MGAKPRKPIPNFTFRDVMDAHRVDPMANYVGPGGRLCRVIEHKPQRKERKPMNKTLKLALKITTGFIAAIALAACALMTSGCQVNVISASPVTVYSDTNTNTETLAAEEVAKR